MMAVDADDRYGSALEVVQDIERFLSATTSASGGQLLADFMTSFFGPERVQSRTRIETLEQLAARGVEVPGRSNPLTRRTDPGTLPAATIAALPREEPTKAIDPPSTAQGQRAGGRRGGVMVAAVLGALLVGVGVTVGVLKALESKTSKVVPLPVPDAAVAEAVVDAGAPEVVDAGTALVVAPEVDAGAEESLPSKSKLPRPVVLTTALVSKGVSGAKGKIQKCFRDHRDELPSPQGTLKLQFTIASSGKVTAASTDLPGTKVSKCVEGAVRAISFPRHVDQEVRVPIALAWDVR
jgi:hypothetical protein